MNTQEPQGEKKKLNELHNLTEDYRQIVSDIMQLSIKQAVLKGCWFLCLSQEKKKKKIWAGQTTWKS